jgi:hypothetical protein
MRALRKPSNCIFSLRPSVFLIASGSDLACIMERLRQSKSNHTRRKRKNQIFARLRVL